jgi:hypothetical protein
MHPMFVKLFIETDADDPLACDEDKRRRSRRVRRGQARMVTRTTVDSRAARSSRRP